MSDSTAEIAAFEQDFLLGIDDMDRTHREFIELLVNAKAADKSLFPTRFRELRDHTREHFAHEERLMRECGFPAVAEHTSEHQRVLGEMDRFLARAEAGTAALARAWLNEQVPEWFRGHLLSMDSALAAHLKLTGGKQDVYLRV